MWANNPVMAGLGAAIIIIALVAGVMSGIMWQEHKQADLCVQDMMNNGLSRNEAVVICLGKAWVD